MPTFYTHHTTAVLPSFLKEFDKKPWTVNEQIKIIHDFLDVSQITLFTQTFLPQHLIPTIYFLFDTLVHYGKDGDVRTLEERVGPGV